MSKDNGEKGKKDYTNAELEREKISLERRIKRSIIDHIHTIEGQGKFTTGLTVIFDYERLLEFFDGIKILRIETPDEFTLRTLLREEHLKPEWGLKRRRPSSGPSKKDRNPLAKRVKIVQRNVEQEEKKEEEEEVSSIESDMENGPVYGQVEDNQEDGNDGSSAEDQDEEDCVIPSITNNNNNNGPDAEEPENNNIFVGANVVVADAEEEIIILKPTQPEPVQEPVQETKDGEGVEDEDEDEKQIRKIREEKIAEAIRLRALKAVEAMEAEKDEMEIAADAIDNENDEMEKRKIIDTFHASLLQKKMEAQIKKKAIADEKAAQILKNQVFQQPPQQPPPVKIMDKQPVQGRGRGRGQMIPTSLQLVNQLTTGNKQGVKGYQAKKPQ